MRKTLFTFALMALIASVSAQNENSKEKDSIPRNNWGAKLIESNFHLGVDLQTKYIWRGMEMITEEAAPVLFPSISYSNKGFYAYIMGGYAINGKYSEVDFGISYSFWWLTLAVNDYYYPTINSPNDQYFNYKTGQTGHWLEAAFTIAPEKAPVYLTVSNFFYGADRYTVNESDDCTKEKQAYSTYAELGTYYDFLKYNRISLVLGAAFNKSCYNGYNKKFGLCNIEMKYTYNATIKDFTLPFSVACIYNPIYNKTHINFTASFAF